MLKIVCILCRIRAEREESKQKAKGDNEDDVSALCLSSACGIILYWFYLFFLLYHMSLNVWAVYLCDNEQLMFGKVKPCVHPFMLISCWCCAAERRAHSTEEALHQGGDGQSADGEEPV